MKIVLVEWDDSASSSGWVSRTIPEHIDACVSVGILVREDDKEIEIAPNLTEDLKLSQIAIPKCSIKRMRTLRL